MSSFFFFFLCFYKKVTLEIKCTVRLWTCVRTDDLDPWIPDGSLKKDPASYSLIPYCALHLLVHLLWLGAAGLAYFSVLHRDKTQLIYTHLMHTGM